MVYSGLQGIVQCDPEANVLHVRRLFCMFFSEELNITLVGICSYGPDGMLPNNISDLKGDYKMCGF